MSRNAGPPPVEQTRALTRQEAHQNVAQQNYLTIVDTLKANNGAEARALRSMFGGNKKLTDKFLAVCFSLLAADSNLLYEATPMSIIEAIKKSASLGLEPLTDEAAIVNYGGTATLLPMYKGYLKRIRNSGLVRAVDAAMVHTEDEFDYGTNQNGWWHTHHPAKVRRDTETGARVEGSTRGAYMGAFAFAVMNNGYVFGRYMDVDELNYIRDTFGKTHSSSGKPLPWTTSYAQMCLKTVIRQLQKLLPQDAVGAEFLELERTNDEATEKLVAAVGEVNDGLAEVRELALRAVGQLPPGEPEKEPTQDEAGQEKEEKEGDGSAEPPDDGGAAAPVAQDPPPSEPPVGAAVAADPGADPNVAAAMQMAEREEQLRRQRQRG